MASTLVLLLQLLLVSLSSASSFFGGTVTYTYKGRNPDGTFRVDLRNRATFDGCQSSLDWFCYAGMCGYNTTNYRGVLDRSTTAPQYNKQWCETETISTRKIPSDNPFQMNTTGCCWIPTRNPVHAWRLMTDVDLGTRSDTGKPNQSPEVAILPLLRVPQNCPRTYKLMSFDPDGDRVRCRYGNIIGTECSSCSQPSGFDLDQGSCTLRYRDSYADTRVYGFELVVEDFPQGHISLTYSDGSRSSRDPLRKRQARDITAEPTALTTTEPSTITAPISTTDTPLPTTTPETTTPARTTPAETTTPITTPDTPLPTTTPETTTPAPTADTSSPTTTRTTTPAPTTRKTTTPAPTTRRTTTPGPTTRRTTTPAPTTRKTTTPAPTTRRTTTPAPTTRRTTTPAPTTRRTTTPAPTTRKTTTPAPTTRKTTTPAPTTRRTTTPAPTTRKTTTPAPTTRKTTTPAPTTRTTTTPVPTTDTSLTTTTPETHTPTPTTLAETTPIPTTDTPLPTTTPETTTPASTTLAETTTTPVPTTPVERMTPIPRADKLIPWYTTTTQSPYTTTPPYTSSRTHLHANTPPLSKLPLQFSVLVDPPAPSCQEGLYLPQFVNPTPEDGAHIQAQVNKEVEIRVNAQATYAEIHDIIISGPLNIRKLRTTHDGFVIRWTPTPDDLGGHYPICFAVESVTGAAIYQSEMRCVLVDIGTTQGSPALNKIR